MSSNTRGWTLNNFSGNDSGKDPSIIPTEYLDVGSNVPLGDFFLLVIFCLYFNRQTFFGDLLVESKFKKKYI